MPASKPRKKADLTVDDSKFGFRTTVCPKCGKINWGPGETIYEIGSSTTRYICNTQIRGGKWCNATVDVKSIEPDLVWVSPNGKWHISDPSVGMPHETAYRNLVQASDDGEVYCTIQMYSDGSFRTDWDVPKYVLEAAKKILRAKAEASPKSRSPKSKERTTTKKTKRRRGHAKGQSIQKTPDG